MDKALSRMYDDVTSGLIGRTEFVEHLAYVMTALQMGEHCYALDVFRQMLKGQLRLVRGESSRP